MRQLVLHRATIHRKWSEDDYDVTHEDVTVGCIFKALPARPARNRGSGRSCFTTGGPVGLPIRGYTESREAAMAAFRAAWDMQKSGGGPPGDEAAN